MRAHQNDTMKPKLTKLQKSLGQVVLTFQCILSIAFYFV